MTSRGVQETAFAEAVKAANLPPKYAGMVALGRRLAQLIDAERGEDGEAAVVVKLAAEYRGVQTALGMSVPAAGKAPAGTSEAPRSPLDELRGRREARTAAPTTAG